MIYPIKADLIPLLENLVKALQPFARANFVNLQFDSNLEELELTYHPESILSQLTQLLCRVITFTPQEYEVVLKAQAQDEFILIQILNTGAPLNHLSEIYDEVNLLTSVHEREGIGTAFNLHIPKKSEWKQKGKIEIISPINLKKYSVPPFYQKLKDSLHSHFTNLENLEKAASLRSEREGVFLQKVNAVIIAHLDDEYFDMQALSKAMALSRSQLYRRLKPLIRHAPAHYIKFVRLQKAKELIDNENLTIGEIAFRTGFSNQSHFTRAFRDLFGFNPSDMRRNNKNEEEIQKHYKTT